MTLGASESVLKPSLSRNSRPSIGAISAGILLFRTRKSLTEVFLVHPGGPYWAGKDIGAWSAAKGVVRHGED